MDRNLARPVVNALRGFSIEALPSPPEIALILVAGLWMLTALATTLLTLTYCTMAQRRSRPADQPPCVVLAPVKGASPTLTQFTSALLRQDYRRYRVIFAVESERDPAFAPLTEATRNSEGRAMLVVAGLSTDRGQKVHNIAIALKAVQPTDEIVVFSDGDFVPSTDWLTQLTRRVVRGHADLATGYLVNVPASERPASVAASLISLGLGTAFSPPGFRLCWGGSTAIRRTTLEALDPEKFLVGTLSDDLSLTRAAYRKRVHIHMSLAVRVPTPTDQSWRSLFAYIRRQYLILRIYAPLQWAFGLWAFALPPLGLAAAVALALSGSAWWLVAPLAVWILQQVRFVLRHRALQRVLDADAVTKLEPIFRLAHLMGPLVQVPHLLAFLASGCGRTIRWAGITYRVDSPERMQIVSRVESS